MTSSARQFAGFAIVAACAAGVVATASTQAQNQDAWIKEMQAKMKAVAALGDHHKSLAKYLGTWSVEMGIVMPGVPSQKSTGTATYQWAIDGRWLSQRITGQLMGRPYESFAIIGFDNYAKNHVVVAVTNADTAMTMARGLVVDPTNKVTAVYGTLDEYTTGELHKPFKTVMRTISDTRHVMEVWDLGIGDAGAKVVEFIFTKK